MNYDLPDFPDTQMGQRIEDYARGADEGTTADPAPVRAMLLLGSALQGLTVREMLNDLDRLQDHLEAWRADLQELDPETEISNRANRDGKSGEQRLKLGRGGGLHLAFRHARQR